MTGIMTLSSKLPAAPPQAIVASLPMTWAQTISSISDITGLTLPGMIELPGCRSGMWISPIPPRGPEPSQRTSLAILVRLTAAAAQRARRLDQAVARRQRLEQVGRLAQGHADLLGEDARSRAARSSGSAPRPVPTAVPPSASSRQRRRRVAATRRMVFVSIWRVARELLPEADRHGVHEVRAARS